MISRISIRQTIGINPLRISNGLKLISQFHTSINLKNNLNNSNNTETPNNKVKNGKKVYYYELPNNKLNPHTYFYRILAVPFLKFCGVIFLTYYTLEGLWYVLDKNDNKDVNFTIKEN